MVSSPQKVAYSEPDSENVYMFPAILAGLTCCSPLGSKSLQTVPFWLAQEWFSRIRRTDRAQRRIEQAASWSKHGSLGAWRTGEPLRPSTGGGKRKPSRR